MSCAGQVGSLEAQSTRLVESTPTIGAGGRGGGPPYGGHCMQGWRKGNGVRAAETPLLLCSYRQPSELELCLPQAWDRV